MPTPTNPDWITWRNSTPRQIVMLDLINGFLPLDPTEMSAEEAWEIHYRHIADFSEVVFSQFKARLADHRRLVRRDLHTAAHEAAALAHDRLLFRGSQQTNVASLCLTCIRRSDCCVMTSETNVTMD
jgi:hypothetical protein